MHEYLVSSNVQLTPSTLLLTLKKDGSSTKVFSFQPGQYAAISFHHRGRPTPARCFSVVSSPSQQSILQFSMRTKGRFTTGLTGLKAGDKVRVRGPFGGFVIDSDRDKDVILLAGGIGITPFMSIIRYASEANLTSNITLVFGCKNQDDVPFSEELINLEKQNPRFRVIFVIGRGPTDKFNGQKVAIGRITTEIIDKVAANNYPQKSFFICGPALFMKGMTNILKSKHVHGSRIMSEAFSQGPNRQTGKIRSWPFNVYVLSACGVALGSFIVMISDLLKTLPPSSILSASSTAKLASLTNSRQTDLDELVNGLPEVASTAPTTDAVNQALQQENLMATASTPTTPPSSTSQTSMSVTPTPSTTPPAKSTPKCTTTQSGVKTCI